MAVKGFLKGVLWIFLGFYEKTYKKPSKNHKKILEKHLKKSKRIRTKSVKKHLKNL
jgi:hypothetical protein